MSTQLAEAALQEIVARSARRSIPKKLRTKLRTASGAELAQWAESAQALAVETEETPAPAPKVDKRVITMTDRQRAERDEIYNSGVKGVEYHVQCYLKGIPTKSNGLGGKPATKRVQEALDARPVSNQERAEVSDETRMQLANF